MIRFVHPGYRSWIRILTFCPSRITDPGVKKASDPGSGSTTLEGIIQFFLTSSSNEGNYDEKHVFSFYTVIWLALFVPVQASTMLQAVVRHRFTLERLFFV
jgi:hypothetical protein